MKIDNQITDLGYARIRGIKDPPTEPLVEGSLSAIEQVYQSQPEDLFRTHALFVGGKRITYPSVPQVLWALRNVGSVQVCLDGEEVEMEAVYTDREQCDTLGAPYMEGGKLVVSARALLESKVCGYDAEHTAFLSRLGDATITLTRTDDDVLGPGWWHVSLGAY